MNDIDKTNIERKNSGKRIRRRKRMMSVYVTVVMLLVATLGITLCFTFLFNVDEIIISGESETYTYMDIVEASGIRAGDNLLRLDTKKGEQQILDQLLYVETADINRDFPSKLRIHVTRCIPAFNVEYDGGVLLVSQKGKILSDNNFYENTLPTIVGYEPVGNELGTQLESKEENNDEAFKAIIKRFDHDNGSEIEKIDMTNEYEIVITYRSGIVFRMGGWNDIEYKMDLAQAAMQTPEVKGKSGYLKMVGNNQCSFRMSDVPMETPEMISPDPSEKADDDAQDTTENGAPQLSQNEQSDDGEFVWDNGNSWNSASDDNDNEDENSSDDVSADTPPSIADGSAGGTDNTASQDSQYQENDWSSGDQQWQPEPDYSQQDWSYDNSQEWGGDYSQDWGYDNSQDWGYDESQQW